MKTFLFTLLFCSNVNAEASAGQGFESFKKNVYPLVVEQCSRCHSDAGPGPNHSSADALTSYKKILGYTDFSDIKNSKFVLKGINNHYDGYLKDTDKKPTITQEELVTAFQKWWDEGENKSFFEGKKVLSEKQIPSLKDDGSFETLSWDLGEIDKKLKGAQFSIEIQQFSSGAKGAYRLKNPSINSNTLAIAVKSIFITINGVGEVRASNFSKISEVISSRSPKTVLEANQIILQEKASDRIGFAFETMKLSNQPPTLTDKGDVDNKMIAEKPNLPIFDESKFGKAAHFVRISTPVEFDVGTPLGKPYRQRNEIPRRVRLTQPFEIQATPVTQIQWYTIMSTNPSKNKPPYKCDVGNTEIFVSKSLLICKNHPVENVTYEEIKEFLTQINSMQNEYIYRVPTEVEWEYVARGGIPIEYDFPWGNDIDLDYAWINDNSGLRSHEVATKRPILSPDGEDFLYDIFGNVWQFVSLSFAENSEKDEGKVHIDPLFNDKTRVAVKGAGYDDNRGEGITVGSRFGYSASEATGTLGFRLVRTKR